MLQPNPYLMQFRTLTLLTVSGALSLASTAQVPTLVKDINPTGNSGVAFLTCFGGETYFSAIDGVHGVELWKTDGTEAGTVMVKDLNPGSGNGNPSNFMEFNGLLHFSATDGINGLQLWRTDGTENGTQVVLSLADVPGLIDWAEFAVLGDRIFFRGRDAVHGAELWSTDGTAAGTELFLDIYPGITNSGIDDPVAHNGKLYFEAFDGVNGPEPWICDGTLAGTHMIAETIPGNSSSGTTPSNFFAAGGLVFFRAGTSATGDELWVTDGTEAGTGLVRDIYPGTNSSLPSNFIEHNGQMHLRAFPTAGSGTARIWQSDGTLVGTVAWPLQGYTNPDNLCSHDGALYITAIGTSGYRQLWRTDNTLPGTYEILHPGSDVISPFSNATAMLSCNGELYFRANYMTATGQELYTLSLTTGIEERALESMQVYPSPASDKAWITIAQEPSARASLILRDLQGRLIATMEPLISDGDGRFQVDLEGIAAGTYIIDLKVGEMHWAKRIIKA